MICNGAPVPAWPVLEIYNHCYRWNLAMSYAWCVVIGLPTEWLDQFNPR
jgi:membrane-bound lytic murein transglycosylase B